MRLSYEWLGDFVELGDVSPNEAAEVLTRLGVEVESLTLIDLSQILIGKVLEQIPHPKSQKPLWVHEVDLGGRVVQIIAGAPNAVAGTLVPVALPGTTVPNGNVVKDMTIAGFKVGGMLCSASELLLGDDHSGILILDTGAPGEPLTTVIPSQAIMEAEVTSNRPDCMGHLGIARELAEDRLHFCGQRTTCLVEPAPEQRHVRLVARGEIGRHQIVLAAEMIVQRALGEAGDRESLEADTAAVIQVADLGLDLQADLAVTEHGGHEVELHAELLVLNGDRVPAVAARLRDGDRELAASQEAMPRQNRATRNPGPNVGVRRSQANASSAPIAKN